MKYLVITGLVALLGNVQPALAQSRYDDRRYDDRSYYYDRHGQNDRYDAYNRDQRWENRHGASPTNRYMYTVSWSGQGYTRPRTRNFTWEQSKDLSYRDGLSEIEMWANAKATQAWLEVVDGAVEFERAEVIFNDGTRLPIDMGGMTRPRGFYPLADFRGWRDVSRVVVLAHSVTPGARLGLHLME